MSEPTFRRPTRSLHGKVAIVTGAGAAGRGIGNGRATAILLAEDGCTVVCVDLKLELAQTTVDMIMEDGQNSLASSTSTTTGGIETKQRGHAIAMQADVSLESDCQRIVSQTISQFHRLDILFNSVGVGGTPGTAPEVDMQEFARGFQINVFSMVQMCKYAIPEMIKNDNNEGHQRGWKGSIVNMASVAGLRGGTPHLLYPTTKGTIIQMTRAMAVHHAKDLIRVNCVCPGMVYTPMMYRPAGEGGSITMTDEARQARRDRSLLKTEGNAWDVASAVRFLAGDEARWITGVDLVVDAGASCAVATDVPREASVNG